MAKFRKKPVVIEAERFDGSEEGASRLSAMYASDVWPIQGTQGKLDWRMGIDTLEGRMIAFPGDWIITGVNGERYPCKPDIFEKSYDFVSA